MAVLRQYLSVAAVGQLLLEAAWFVAAMFLAVGLQRHGRGLSDVMFAPALVFAALVVAANGLAGLYRSDRKTPLGALPVANARCAWRLARSWRM